jgi:hypothetical protein
MARTVVLHSPLDPVALATRLRDTLGGRKAKPKKGVTGQGDETTMMLLVYRGYSGASGTRFRATMDPDDAGGTRIEGRFGIARGMECGLILWCGFLSIFLFTGLAICLNGGAWEVGVPFMVISSLMMVVPITLWWFGTRYSATDEAAIRAFLADTVEATEADHR